MTDRIPPPGDGPPKISIVIAVRGDARDSLAAFVKLGKASPVRMEIIASGRVTSSQADLCAEFPDVVWMNSGCDQFTPVLWETGIRVAQAPIVALTTSAFRPDPGWIEHMLAAHGDDRIAAVGGAIDQMPTLNAIAWATFFCRYSAFMPPLTRCESADVAADNASYKKAAIDHYPQSRTRGFWETEIHHEMRRDGFGFLLEPEAVLRHVITSGFFDFAGQRFRHGEHFAQDRGARMGAGEKALRALLFPLAPFVMVVRIYRRVFARKHHRLALVLSSPLLLLFLTAWAAGECAGYMSTRRSIA